MNGRIYRWRNGYWRVLCRWSGKGPRNVLLEPVVRFHGVGWGDQWFPAAGGWWRPAPELGPALVRPFRGLRRVKPEGP